MLAIDQGGVRQGHAQLVHHAVGLLELLLLALEVVGLQVRQHLLGVLEAHAQALDRLAGGATADQIGQADCSLRHADDALAD